MQQTEEDLSNTFESIWKNLLSKFSPRDTFTTTATVNQCIENELFNHINPRGLGGKMIDMLKSPKKHNDLHIVVRVNHHYTASKSSWFSTPDEHLRKLQAEDVTRAVFKDSKKYIEETTSKDTDFKPAFVQQLLSCIDSIIAQHCEDERIQIRFTNTYYLEIYLVVCGYAKDKFEKMAVLFDQKHDPKNYLEKNEKIPLYTKFISQFKKAEAEITIADTLVAYLELPIKEQVQKSTGVKLVMHMRESEPYFSNKKAIKAKILKDLHKKNLRTILNT